MAKLDIIAIKENIIELKQLHRKAGAHLQPRVQMLVLIKSNKAHSKMALATALGVSDKTVHNWKTAYKQGGLEQLLKDGRGGKKKPIIDTATSEAIRIKLSNAKEAPTSFKALQQWVEEHYIPGINYQTLNKYVKRKFGAKLKVARKSHVRKSEQAISAFKKNQ